MGGPQNVYGPADVVFVNLFGVPGPEPVIGSNMKNRVGAAHCIHEFARITDIPDFHSIPGSSTGCFESACAAR